MAIPELAAFGLERMDDDTISEFISTQSIGVLGLPTEHAPYMIPMSYAFDGDGRLYFTYLLGPSSRKATLSDQADRARFLIYAAETQFNWRSVLLTGEIDEIPEAEYSERIDSLSTPWRPELFQAASDSVELGFYEFSVQSRNGVRHTGLASGFKEGVEY